jgi:hypothetical protein
MYRVSPVLSSAPLRGPALLLIDRNEIVRYAVEFPSAPALRQTATAWRARQRSGPDAWPSSARLQFLLEPRDSPLQGADSRSQARNRIVVAVIRITRPHNQHRHDNKPDNTRNRYRSLHCSSPFKHANSAAKTHFKRTATKRHFTRLDCRTKPLKSRRLQ